MSQDKTKNALNKISKIYEKTGIFIVLILLVILLSIFAQGFFSTYNLINIVRQIAFIAIIGFGVTGVIISGGIDLSSGSIVGVTSVIVAMVAHPGQMPLVFTLVIGLSVGLVAGFINGFLIAKAKLPPFIATLGMYTAGRGFALMITSGRPVNELSEAFTWLGAGKIWFIPVPVIIMVLVAVLTHILHVHTKSGKHMFAVGGNTQAAIISGVNADRTLIKTYTFAGLLASVAGIVLTARISSGQPNLGIGYELNAIAATVIGGTSMAGGVGTIFGTVCGALIIGVINNGMELLNVNVYWQQIIQGIIIILAVLIDQIRHRGKKS